MSIREDARSHAWVKSQGFDAWHGGHCATTNDAPLTQNWGMAEPAVGCPVDNFQVLSTGFLKAPVAGVYHFRVIANDAFDLDLNGKGVLQYWDSSTGAGKTFTTTTSQAQTLRANTIYPITLWYRDFTKEAHFKVQWKYPGSGDFADIPTSVLSSSATTLLGAGNQQVTACEVGIGLSPDCPAYSPQELWDIHGTDTNGEYWLMVAGQPTKVHILMDPAFTENRGRGYLQLMWIGGSNGGGYTGLSGSGSRFQYDSPLWTDQYLTLNAGAAPTGTSKRNTYNYTPVNKLLAMFDGAANYTLVGPTTANFTRDWVNGDVSTPPQAYEASHFWIEEVPSYATGKPAYDTFNSPATRTEAVIEPITDRSLTSSTTTTNRTVTRYKIPMDTARKNQLLGVIENPRYIVLDPRDANKVILDTVPGKSGAFSAAQNPYNEWYGFNFQSQEWNGRSPHLKMRWGFFSMARQDPPGDPTRQYWEPYLNPHEGEAENSIYYQAPFCDIQGDGISQFTNLPPCLGGLDRFLAIGGIGLVSSNAGAYQPVESSTNVPRGFGWVPNGEVQLTGGRSLSAQCARPGGVRITSGDDSWGQQSTNSYQCAYSTGVYGQMPDPSLTAVSTVTATARNGAFDVTWSAVTGATEYVFAHRKLGEPWKATRILNPSSLSQVVPERGPGTYQFKVTARKYDSPISFNSSAPTTVEKEVGVGLGGGDELLLADGSSTVTLKTSMAQPLAVSGLPANAVVGLTVSVTSASATIPTFTGLSTNAAQTVAVTSAIDLNSATPTVTVYGNATNIQAALESIVYQHLDPANPIGSITVEAFDAGTSEVLFNPNNQHYYKVVTKGSEIGFRNAFCEVKTGGTHSGGDNYDNCSITVSGRANHNGVPGYLATITSSGELDWLASSGLLNHLVATTSIANDGESGQRGDDDMWIGATDLEASTNSTDGNFRWTNQAPTVERGGLVLDWVTKGQLTNSAITGIQAHQRASTKLSMTLLKTNITNFPTYVFANADSGGNDNVRSYLIEYSDDNGRNPLYTQRTIEFALAPTISSHTTSSLAAQSAQVTIGVDPANSATAIEVSYTSPDSSEAKYATVSPAERTSAGSSVATFSGLQPFTTYDYTITTTNEGGTDTETGTFTTAAGVAETLALSARDITSTSAVIGAAVTANAAAVNSVTVHYGTDPALTTPAPTSVSIGPGGLSGTIAQTATTAITGLIPNTQYYYRTTVVNSAGTSTSDILTFTTPPNLSTNPNQFGTSDTVDLGNGIEVTAHHPKIFPADFSASPAQDATYVSYTVTNTSNTTKQDVWISLQDFSGGSVKPVFPGESPQLIGDLASGQSATVFFFLQATGATEVNQDHVVKISQGQPGTSAESSSSSTVFTFDAVRSPGESNSVITDVRFNTSAPPLGGDFKVTVTGTLNSFTSSSDSLFLTPANNSTWPADSLRLNGVRIEFPGVTSTPGCPSVVLDVQQISNNCYQGQRFEATYTFTVIDTPASTLTVNPAVLTSGSGAWSANDTTENPAVLVNLRPQQNLSVVTTVPNAASSTQTTIGGTTYSSVTVEIDVTNTSLRTSSVDQIIVDLEPTTRFDPSTAYLLINGTRYPVSASVIDSTSNVIAIDGPIPAKAGDDVTVVLELQVPTGTSDTVAVTGKIGDVIVGPTPGNQTTTTVTTTGGGAISSSSTTSATAPRTESVSAIDVFATTATLQGKVSDAPSGATLSFKVGQSPDLNFNTDTVAASPPSSSGAPFELFGAAVTGLVPGSTYYYQALYNGVPAGDVLSFTTKQEDQPFVGLSSQPLPVAVICDEPELGCAPTVINPPVVSCVECDLRYSISSGTLPPGMSLDEQTGVISGTPTGTGGNYPFTLTVTSTDPNNSNSSNTASQTYNLISQPATAEPQILGANAGNISKDSAFITADMTYVPNGELVRLIVKDTATNTIIVNEVIGEGTGSKSQLFSSELKGLLASTNYSYRLVFGTQESTWFEFVTTATATVPTAPGVSESQATQVGGSSAEITSTISNPLPGDALGFVVGTNAALSDGRTYIAGNGNSSSQQTVSTLVANLAPGNYYYRVLLGDGLSTQTYQFTLASLGGASGGSENGRPPVAKGTTPERRGSSGARVDRGGEQATRVSPDRPGSTLRPPAVSLLNTFTSQVPRLPGQSGASAGTAQSGLDQGTIDVGESVQSAAESRSTSEGDQTRSGATSGSGVRTVQEMREERLGGFSPGSSTRVEILGSRTGARFVVTQAEAIDSFALIKAIQSSLPTQSTDFFALSRIVIGQVPPAPTGWNSDHRAAIEEFFRASGLAAPRSLADLDIDASTEWLQVSASAQTYAPGSVVYLTLTSEPLVIGSAVVDETGFVEIAGAFPSDLLEAGEHRIRLVGIRMLDGASVDADGEVQLSDELMAEIELFDLGTQATIAIIGSNQDGGTHTALRVVTLIPEGPWWLLWLILGSFLLVSVARFRGVLAGPGQKAIGVAVVGLSAIPAVIWGWMSTVTAVAWWALVLSLVGAALTWFVPQASHTQKGR